MPDFLSEPGGSSKRVVITRKSALVLLARTPAFVSSEVGAAELGISPETISVNAFANA
jgi:hypothetical protein